MPQKLTFGQDMFQRIVKKPVQAVSVRRFWDTLCLKERTFYVSGHRLLITVNSGRILVCDFFPDAFLFEVIAMYLEEDGVYGEEQDIALNAVQNGTTFLQSRHYTFLVIDPLRFPESPTEDI